jgi:hypothetical protein
VGDLRRGQEMNMCVDGSWGCDQALASNDLGAGTDDQARVYPILDARVPGLTDSGYAAIVDSDVGLDDP